MPQTDPMTPQPFPNNDPSTEGRKALVAEGWTYIYNSPKWHYFRAGKSLCGRFMLLGKPELEAHSGEVSGENDCKGCYRKLEKERVQLDQIRIERLETQVAALRLALQACMDDFGISLCYCTELAKGDCAFCMGQSALAASPAANCEACGKPHPCWCPAPDARPAATCVPHKEKE